MTLEIIRYINCGTRFWSKPLTIVNKDLFILKIETK